MGHAFAGRRRVQGCFVAKPSACRYEGDPDRRTGGTAVFAFGARRKNRGIGAFGKIRRPSLGLLYHVGGLCYYGNGGKGIGIGILPSLILSAFLTILRFARLRSPFTAGSGLPVKTKTAFRPRRENLRNTCAFAKRKREKNKQKPLEIFEGLSLSVVFYRRIT